MIESLMIKHSYIHSVQRNSFSLIVLSSSPQFSASNSYRKAQPPAFIPGTGAQYYDTLEVQ
jgi:hypothetical protein